MRYVVRLFYRGDTSILDFERSYGQSKLFSIIGCIAFHKFLGTQWLRG